MYGRVRSLVARGEGFFWTVWIRTNLQTSGRPSDICRDVSEGENVQKYKSTKFGNYLILRTARM